MNVLTLSGKDKKNLLNEILEKNNLEEKEVLYKITEQKTGLFKSTSYKIEVVKLTEILDYLKKYLLNLLNKMGIDVTFETKIRENQIYIKMFSDKNAILIGKNGQTLKALQAISKQVISNEAGVVPYIILDVENYKDKQLKNIEYTAKKVAKEVRQTGIEASLENMNSYERRIVHNALANFKGIVTESEGVEPNRHVVIKKAN